MKNLNLVKKSERNKQPEVEQVEMDPMEGTSGMYNDNQSSITDENEDQNETSDSDKTMSDSETETDLETPVFKLQKRRLQKCSSKNENRVVKNLRRQYICQFCEKPFTTENKWIVHFKYCKDWLEKLQRSEEEFNETSNDQRPTQRQEENLRLAKLYKIFEEQIIDSRTNEREKEYTQKQLSLITTVANIVAATKKELRHQENEAIARKLLIQQYQIQKDRDDQELITHRAAFVNFLNTLWNLNSILEKNKIIFLDKNKNSLSKDKKILEWDQPKEGSDLTCEICKVTFEDEQLTLLHKELLYCTHDGGINNKIKKYLTREKRTRMSNCHMELAIRIEQIDKAVEHYAAVSRIRIEQEKEKEMNKNVPTMSSKKRKFN